MSDTAGNNPPNRNNKGRFIRGVSGNTRGRPIKNLGRADVPDQLTRDFLAEMSEPMTIRNADGTTEEFPYIIALIKTVKARAAKSNDIKHGIELIKLHQLILTANEKKLPNDGKLLSDYENLYLTAKNEDQRELARTIRRLRKATRRD